MDSIASLGQALRTLFLKKLLAWDCRSFSEGRKLKISSSVVHKPPDSNS